MLRTLLPLTVVLASLASSASAQTIGLLVGDTTLLPVSAGARVAIPLRLDLRDASGAPALSSVTGTVTWGAARLTFDSVRSANAALTLTTNTGSAASGAITLTATAPSALAISGPLVTLHFTATASTGGTRVRFTPTAAGHGAQSALAALRLRALDLCVAPPGRWGDVNDDATVNVVDAQQVARFQVGLSVANATALAARGDVNADGRVSVIDAQQVARFSVGLSVSGRMNAVLYVEPTAASLGVSPGVAPVVRAGEALEVAGDPRDGAGASLAGCAPVIFSSDAPGVATVTPTGTLAGVAPGMAWVTATASSGRVQQRLLVRVANASGVRVGEQPIPGGESHACALATSGAAHCWGANWDGQLGDGTFTNRSAPVPVGGGQTFVAVTAGSRHSCGVTATGAAHCWGGNFVAQLGDGTFTARTTPVPVQGGVAFAQVASSATSGHSCGINTAGAAYCWGANGSSQLGDGTTTTRTTPVLVGGGMTWVQVVVGGGHSCGLTVTGAAYCWGDNWGGQVGDGSTTRRAAPTLVTGGRAFVALTAGHTHSCGLAADGTAYCWGDNGGGWLGDGTRTNRQGPTAVAGGQRFRALNTNGQTTCGVTVAGTASCWGQGYLGQLANGQPHDLAAPVTLPGGLSWRAVGGGNSFTCGVTSGGAPLCWGHNGFGAVGTGSFSNRTVPFAVAGAPALTSVSAGGNHACGLTAAGAAYCWGFGRDGQLGDGSAGVIQVSPRLVAGGHSFRALSAGGLHSCALTQAGAAYCWGGNWSGELGDGTTSMPGVPAPVTGGLAFTGISAGASLHSCAVTQGGAAFCWGTNGSGQVGDGSTTLRTAPTAVATGVAFASVVAGQDHSCALTAAGAAYCWGSNSSGQLGDGTTTNRLTPVAVAGGLTFTRLALGQFHSCGLTPGGAMYCWGDNNYRGQLGDGTQVNRSTPTAVTGGLTFTGIAAGGLNSCGITAAGVLYCWGAPNSGVVGSGAPTWASPTPRIVSGGPALAAVSLGGSWDFWGFGCGLTTAGAPVCWGSNTHGQLGDGLALPWTPTAVSGGLVVRTP